MSLEKLIGLLPPAEKLLNTIGSNDVQNELVGKKGNFPYEKITGLHTLNLPINDVNRKIFIANYIWRILVTKIGSIIYK